METLFKKHRVLVSQVSMKIVRQLMNNINWEKQLVSIRGSRGVGKTTLMRQYIKRKYGVNAGEALYLVMDSMYFTNHTVLRRGTCLYAQTQGDAHVSGKQRTL